MKLTTCFLFSLTFSQAFAQNDWPDFRGPLTNGHVPSSHENPDGSDLPLVWSETENVTWKTPIPHLGWSTPVIMNDQIWLTTATKDGHEFFVICVDAKTGEILLNKKLFHSDNPEPLGNPLNGYASPSPVIEPGRVYVHFGSYGTACLDTETFEVLWQRDDMPCRHFRGPGSSPFLFENSLILSMDGVDVQYMIALDKRTGKTLWKTDRSVEFKDLGPDGKPMAEGDFRKAYGTPILVEENGEKQLITVGAKAAYSYNPATGEELWKVRYDSFSGAARPVYGDGVVFIAAGFGPAELLAIRTDGRGDVKDSHIAWRRKQGAPEMPSPILVDDLLFWVNDNGVAYCV